MRTIQKRYVREIVLATLVYVALILVFAVAVPDLKVMPWSIVPVLLPLLPVLAMIRAMVRLIRARDELGRRIDPESFAIASMLTGFGFFSIGLLLSVGAFARPPAFLTAILAMPALFGTFGVAKGFVSRWYAKA